MGVVHCKRDPYDVYVGRGRCPQSGELGQWGNPFSHRSSKYQVIRVATIEEAIERYRSWLWSEIAAERIDLAELAALDGKTLGCWCAPNPCHGECWRSPPPGRRRGAPDGAGEGELPPNNPTQATAAIDTGPLRLWRRSLAEIGPALFGHVRGTHPSTTSRARESRPGR